MSSPITTTNLDCTEDHAKEVYKCFRCDQKLAGRQPVTLQGPVPHDGSEYRMEERTSEDGTCVLQEDIITDSKGRERRFIVSLEVDGKVWWVRRTEPIQ